MGNFIWTGILYLSTLTIVLVCYRAFIQDRKTEREASMKVMIERAYLKTPANAQAVVAQEKVMKNQIPGRKVETPPWMVKAKRA
jgi:hypothetical protein